MKREYTHYAKFYGIPCYFNEYTSELKGRNKVYAWLLDIAVWIEAKYPSSEYGFPIEIGKALDENNTYH